MRECDVSSSVTVAKAPHNAAGSSPRFTGTARSYPGKMDISAFDFSASELGELLEDLAPLANAVEIEPRLHQEDEMSGTADGMVPMHEGLVGPTFRIRFRLRSGDGVVARLASLEATRDVSVVLDRGGIARIRHARATHPSA
jgi:hypothetical protein